MEFLKEMLLHSEREIYMTGNRIVSQGQISESLYLIWTGEVICSGKDSVVTTLYPGAFFGLVFRFSEYF